MKTVNVTATQESQVDTTSESAMRERMLSLCTRALKAELGFAELVAEFPTGSPSEEYFAIVYEDLVDGVEHLPGKLSGEIDYKAWSESEAYAALKLHVLLLGGRDSLGDLPALYNSVRVHDPLPVERIGDLLAKERDRHLHPQ